MKNEKKSQNSFLKVDPRSTFRNNFLQPATKDQRTFSLREKLMTQGEKPETFFFRGFLSRHARRTKRESLRIKRGTTRGLHRPKTSNETVLRDTLKDFVLFRRLYSRVGCWPADSL